MAQLRNKMYNCKNGSTAKFNVGIIQELTQLQKNGTTAKQNLQLQKSTTAKHIYAVVHFWQ